MFKYKKLSVFLTLSFLTLFSTSSFAKQNLLAKLLQSDSSDITSLSLVVNDLDEIQQLEIKKNGKVKYLTPAQLKGKGKAVLKKMGIKIIVLKSNNFDTKLGGIITINYLRKFKLIGKNIRKEFDVELVRSEDSKWILLHNDKQFSQVLFKVGSKGIESAAFR